MTGSYVMIHMPYVMMVLLNGNEQTIVIYGGCCKKSRLYSIMRGLILISFFNAYTLLIMFAYKTDLLLPHIPRAKHCIICRTEGDMRIRMKLQQTTKHKLQQPRLL